jgi:hypothetical protein
MHQPEVRGHAWRINSPNLAPPLDREYLTQSQKDRLFKAANNTCSICGKTVEPGVRGLQADHKIPISRGGTNALENWQPICNQCNVGKRRACENCIIDCKSCSWAYPEIIGINTLVSINERILAQINEYSKIANKTMSSALEEAAIYFLDNKDK